MAIGPDLSAASDERVGVDHGSITHICPCVDVHRRHASDSLSDVTAVTDRRSTGNDTNAAVQAKLLDGIGGFIEPWLPHGMNGHVYNRAHPEPQQNPFLDPCVYAPAGFGSRVGLGGPNPAIV